MGALTASGRADSKTAPETLAAAGRTAGIVVG